MNNLHYEITILTNKQKVWDIMLGEETYNKWVKAFSENSEKEGEWKQGTYINFIDSGVGGTRALLEVVDEPNRILAKHIAVLSKEGQEDIKSDSARKWIGTTEEYILSEINGVTTLKIEMKCSKDFNAMFNKCWPEALTLLKNLCEGN